MKSKDICNDDLRKFDALEYITSANKRLRSEVVNKRFLVKLLFIVIGILVSFNIAMAWRSGEVSKKYIQEIDTLFSENSTLRIKNETLEKVLGTSCLVSPKTLFRTGGM